VVSFLQVSFPKSCTRFSCPPQRHTPFPSDPALFYQPYHLENSINHAVHDAALPLFYFFLVLSSKYIPQHLILWHTQPMFLPQCGRPSFTPTQNKQSYTSVYSNLRQQRERLLKSLIRIIIRYLQNWLHTCFNFTQQVFSEWRRSINITL